MALYYGNHDFNPPLLSRKWFVFQCRPNMLLHCRSHIISILESGLMFREDSAKIEQELVTAEGMWVIAGETSWMTRGEKLLSVLASGAALGALPPKSGIFNRGTVIRIMTYAALPLIIRISHRLISRVSNLNCLLQHMRDYLVLIRRTMACVKEYRMLHKGLGSVTTMLDAATKILFIEQMEMSFSIGHVWTSVQGNFPWIYDDTDYMVLYDLAEYIDNPTERDLMRVHHGFLVTQSSLLKRMAMVHFLESQHAKIIYGNHNERLYWLHTDLLASMNEKFKKSFETINRIYRLLRNYGSNYSNVPKKSTQTNNSWLYSDVHTFIARANIELKVALNRCTDLDVFLDSCACNKHNFDVEVLNKDLDDLIDGVSNCLDTVQKSQIKLKKIQNKFDDKKEKMAITEEMQSDLKEDNRDVVRIGEVDIEPKDEVFFFVKTEEDDVNEQAGDTVTAPGKKEKEATKVVLKELKRKLVKREDLMRERERKALGECMPELKGNMPEFPRQIQCDVYDKKGFIAKIRKIKGSHIYKQRKIRHHRLKEGHRVLKRKILKQLVHRPYSNLSEMCKFNDIYENIRNRKPSMVDVKNKKIRIIVCHNAKSNMNKELSDVSEVLSGVEGSSINKSEKISKKDLELTSSSSDDDQREKQDVRRNRVAKKKIFPTKRGNLTVGDDADESLKPMEYSFGTGMAMASMLQLNKLGNKSLAQEEVFVGDGEVSEDSGNDIDA